MKRLSADFRARHLEIPRPLIAGMRNQLVHAYDAVDLDEVRRTLKHEVHPGNEYPGENIPRPGAPTVTSPHIRVHPH